MKDASINQCADFFGFSCGAFNNDAFNAGKDASFLYTHQVAANTMRFIVSSIVNTSAPDQSKVSGFHHACMEHGVDSADFKRSHTLQTLLGTIDRTVKTYGDLASVWGMLQRYDTILPLELTFELDPSDSTRLLPMLKQSGLFDDAGMIESKEHMDDVSGRMAIIGAPAIAAEWAKQIVAIERAIALRSVRVPAANIIEYMEKHNGKDDVIHGWKDHFAHLSFDLSAFIEAANPGMSSSKPWLEAVQSRPLWAYRLDFIERLPELIRQFSVASWIVYTKHAVLFHINNGNDAPRLDPERHYAYHRQYDSRYSLPWQQPRRFLMQPICDTSLAGGPLPPNMSPESKTDVCLSLTEAYLPVVLDNYFVNSYLPESAKRRTAEVALAVKDTMVRMIRAGEFFSFMPELDRLAMASKVDSVRMQIGTPNVWPIDRSALAVDPESYAESVLLIRKYHVDKNYRFFLGHVGGELEVNGDTLFDGLVSNANAYYQHQINTVIITAGLIQPPLFSTLFDRVSVYSRFGATIAHELAHSIDAVGILFDTTGTYNPWLSPEAAGLYANRRRCLIDVYTAPTPFGNTHDGKKTLNENIADLIGFTVAYRAFMDDVGSEASVQDQRDFFLSYSQMYCEAMNRMQEMALIARRSHSLNSFRVNNVVTQHPTFDSLWECNRYDRGNHLKNTCSLN
jgi:predicted metalloendopeptidase